MSTAFSAFAAHLHSFIHCWQPTHPAVNGDRESNEDPPSSVDRPTKRVKTSTECADTATLTAPPSLPPDAWAAVMECLKLSDVLSLSSTCRAIYHDAVPLVTTLHITKPRQMDPFLSKRFTDIRDIYIYSLLNRQPDYKYDVDFETSVRVATFLSNNFAKAERVFIVCISYGDPYIHWDTVKNSADNRIKISNLIESFSTGFRSRALSPTLSIRGMRCLQLQSFSHNDCQVCRRACESFPLEAVARFECRGSSKIQARSSRPYDLDVCLGRETVEEILSARPGGHELLHSHYRLFHLLRRGTLTTYEYYGEEDEDEPTEKFYMVHYSDSQLEEIKRVIQYAQIDVSTLKASEITQTIMKSFSTDERLPYSLAHNRFLSEKSLESLNAIGLRVEEEEEDRFRSKVLGLLDEIVSEINCCLECGDYVFNELLSLLSKLVTLRNPPIQELLESDILDSLILFSMDFEIEDEQDSYAVEASLNIMTMILLYKTFEDSDHETKLSYASVIRSLVNDGSSSDENSNPVILSFIVKALSCSDDDKHIGVIGACILSKIASQKGEELTKSVVESGAIACLVSFANKNAKDILASEILSSVSDIAKSSRAYRGELMKHDEITEFMSSRLVKGNESERQKMISAVYEMVMDEDTDSSFLRRFVSSVDMTSFVQSSMTSSVYSTIFTETVDIVTVLLKKLRQDSIIAAVVNAIVNAEVIPKFANLILMSYSGHLFINAITSLDIIITTSSLYRDEFLKTDVVKHLCKGLTSQHGLARAMQGSCLSIIFHAIEHHSDTSEQIVRMMIESKLMPFLIQKATSWNEAERDHDEIAQTFAMKILSVIAREQNTESTYFAMAGAGSNFITNLVGVLKRECNAACDILVLLNQIADFSPYYRVKVMSSGIMKLIASGIGSEGSNLSKAWMRLFHTLASGDDKEAAVEVWINTGIVRKLIELMIDSKQPIESKTRVILMKARDRFIKKESSRLDLLQKKKAWLKAKACQEATEQLQKTINDMSLLQSSVEPTDSNIQRQLDQMNSQLSKAQAALKKANQDAKKVEIQKILEKSDLPKCADTVDHEILRSTLLIEEAIALDDVSMKSEQESVDKPKQKKQSKLLAWMSKGK